MDIEISHPFFPSYFSKTEVSRVSALLRLDWSSASEPQDITFFSVCTLAILMLFIFDILLPPILGIKVLVFHLFVSARIFACNAISFLMWAVLWIWHNKRNNKYFINMTIFHMLSNSTKHNFSSLEKQTNFSSNNNYGRYSTLPEKLGGFIPETRFSPLFSCLQFYFFYIFIKFSFFVYDNLPHRAWMPPALELGTLLPANLKHESKFTLGFESGVERVGRACHTSHHIHTATRTFTRRGSKQDLQACTCCYRTFFLLPASAARSASLM